MRMHWLFGAIAAAVVTGAAQAAVLDCEDLTPATQYNVGDILITDGVSLKVEPFTWSNGSMTSGGYAKVDTIGRAGASGQDIQVNNVNLALQIPMPFNGLSLQYGEYGGNLNLEINGDFRNFANFVDLNGTTVGGTLIHILDTGTAGNSTGALFVIGDISSFAVGGQELWVDNVIASVVPEPASVTLLGLGGLLLARRRRAA